LTFIFFSTGNCHYSALCSNQFKRRLFSACRSGWFNNWEKKIFEYRSENGLEVWTWIISFTQVKKTQSDIVSLRREWQLVWKTTPNILMFISFEDNKITRSLPLIQSHLVNGSRYTHVHVCLGLEWSVTKPRALSLSIGHSLQTK